MMRPPQTTRVMINFGLTRRSEQATFRAILDYARTHGPWQCLSTEDRSLNMGPEPWDGGVTGIIASGGFSEERGMQYVRSGVPVVIIDPAPALLDSGLLKSMPFVHRDSRAIGAMAARHYLERGYRNFAWVGEPTRWYWSAERRAGYEEALAEAGFSCHVFEPADEPGSAGILPAASSRAGSPRSQEGILPAASSRAGSPRSQEGTLPAASSRAGSPRSQEVPESMARLTRFLRSLPVPTAVFAANDEQGRRVLNASTEAGLRVPEQIAVLGVDDDILLCESTVPALSSIRKGDYRCGQIAAGMLDAVMHGRDIPEPHVAIAPIGVVMRGSTGYDAMSDATVARALTYIRTHAATGPVAVDEVAAASKCSRRYLERTFRAKLGRSVHEEIALARIERVKRLLETDSASIGEIIGITGFSGEKHLSILFRRITGTTMTDWRRAHRDQAK